MDVNEYDYVQIEVHLYLLMLHLSHIMTEFFKLGFFHFDYPAN